MSAPMPAHISEDEWEDGGYLMGVGTVSRMHPFDGLTDDEADELLEEIAAREARRLPFGFQAPSE